MKPLTTAGLLALASPSLQSQTIGDEANAFSPTAWSDAVTHSRPNASNVVRVPGFDIREPFPGGAAGWILGANVTASVPLPGDNPDSSSFTTAVEVAFMAPPGWIDRNHSHHSWSVAQGFYLSSRLRTDDNVVPGDCTSTLSSDCRDAWIASLAQNYANGTLGHNGMAPPPECEDELRVDDDDRERFDMLSNSSSFPLQPSADGKIVRYASGNHSEDDLDGLEEAMRQVWVAGIVFGPSNTSNTTSDSFPAARLACVRGNQTVGPPPSEWGDDDNDDSVGMVRPGSAWAAMIVAAGFAAAML